MTKTGTALALIAGLALASGSAFAGEDKDKAAADEARNQFMALDANGDKQISAEEAKADESLAEAIGSADANGDGVLSWEEFQAYTMKEMSGEGTEG